MGGLQTLLSDFTFENLPPAWTTGDLASFSRGKTLWKYQADALRNALIALWLYYDGEDDEGGDAPRKARFFKRYRDNDVPLLMSLNVGKKRDHLRLLQPYYTLTPTPGGERELPYVELINRMGFWMATGSGKTLVIVKLLQQLWTLMQYDLIPRRDVLVLTHREDLLGQLRDHGHDFNTGGAAPHLRLRELREYPEAKREHPSLPGRQELTVFTHRSDNLSDTQKERIIDFRNYENGGKWYVLLDEAHKGDKEDSKEASRNKFPNWLGRRPARAGSYSLTRPKAQIAKLRELRNAGQLDEDAYDAARIQVDRIQPTATFDHNGQRLHIKHLAEHYFLPLLISDADKLDYINHVIRTASERRFLNQLEEYLKEGDRLFKQYDWWLFSRTDETLDRVVLPYYDLTQNRIRDFHPDFAFWLIKGQAYTILFVDPKGMKIGDYQHKIAGYKEHFRDATGGYREIPYEDYRVRVALLMYHDSPDLAVPEFKPYWCDSPQTMLGRLAQ